MMQLQMRWILLRKLNTSYAAKVATIKESYLSKDTTVEATPEVDAITEETQETQVVSDQMQKYLSAMTRT